jgi:hypothetical protein
VVAFGEELKSSSTKGRKGFNVSSKKDEYYSVSGKSTDLKTSWNQYINPEGMSRIRVYLQLIVPTSSYLA